MDDLPPHAPPAKRQKLDSDPKVYVDKFIACINKSDSLSPTEGNKLCRQYKQ